MMYPTKSVEAKTRFLTCALSILAIVVLASGVFAQQPSTNAPTDARQTKTAPTETVEIIFSPWAKYCTKGPANQSSEIRAKEVCFTAADGHIASGQKLAIALLIEPQGSDAKLLRVTLPLGVALVPGARIVIDEREAMRAPFVACQPKNGCMADFKADAELIEKLKTGRSLAIQAFDRGKPISFTLPLSGFAKAFAGPASDPTGLQEGLASERTADPP